MVCFPFLRPEPCQPFLMSPTPALNQPNVLYIQSAIFCRCSLTNVEHRIRINREGKAKVVAGGWGTYLNVAVII